MPKTCNYDALLCNYDDNLPLDFLPVSTAAKCHRALCSCRYR